MTSFELSNMKWQSLILSNEILWTFINEMTFSDFLKWYPYPFMHKMTIPESSKMVSLGLPCMNWKSLILSNDILWTFMHEIATSDKVGKRNERLFSCTKVMEQKISPNTKNHCSDQRIIYNLHNLPDNVVTLNTAENFKTTVNKLWINQQNKLSVIY